MYLLPGKRESVTLVLVARTSAGGTWLGAGGRDRRCPQDKRARRAKEASHAGTVTRSGLCQAWAA